MVNSRKDIKYMITGLLIAINAIVFILLQTKALLPNQLGSSYYMTITNKQYYRIFTSAFTQYTLIHLFCNMASLWSLGTILETKLGSMKFLAIYIMFVILCETTSVLIHNLLGDVKTISIGASGVICALFAMLIVYGIRLNGVGILKHYYVTILMLLFMTFDKRIDSIAHFTGVGYGIIASFIFLTLK